MKKGPLNYFFIFLLLTVCPAAAQSLWRETTGRAAPARGRCFQLDSPAFGKLLRQPSDTFEMELPQPSGELLLFKIWPARVLPELLSARFPGIKTFAGRAARNPAVGIRLEWTPRGLSALVLAPGGDYAVEPAAPAGFNQDYRVFFTKDLPAAGREAVCGSEGSLGVDLRDGQGGIRSLGDTLKEYRIAVSATGEYTRFHGGTAEAALGAIAAVINHVNGIYERDLSVRLVLA